MTKGDSLRSRISARVRGQKYTHSAQSVFPDVQKVNCPVGAREATLGCATGKNGIY